MKYYPNPFPNVEDQTKPFNIISQGIWINVNCEVYMVLGLYWKRKPNYSKVPRL